MMVLEKIFKLKILIIFLLFLIITAQAASESKSEAGNFQIILSALNSGADDIIISK